MSDTSTETVPVESTNGTDEVVHTICCDDRNLALCGADVTLARWLRTGGTDCVECHKVNQSGECPKYGRCASPQGNFN